MEGQMSLNRFVETYRAEKRASYHQRMYAPGPIAMRELERTYSVVREVIPEGDISAYIGFVIRWAKSKGFVADHKILRSKKLMEGYLFKAHKAAKKFVPPEAFRAAYEPKVRTPGSPGVYEREFTEFVGLVNKRLDAGFPLLSAFAEALEGRKWKYGARMERLCRMHLRGGLRLRSTLKRFGVILHEPAEAE